MKISVFEDNNARDTRRINTNKMAKASSVQLLFQYAMVHKSLAVLIDNFNTVMYNLVP